MKVEEGFLENEIGNDDDDDDLVRCMHPWWCLYT